MKDWGNLVADEDKILTKHFTKGRGGHKIDKVVVHHNMGNLSIAGCYSVWQSRAASAHYQVDSNGRIGQLVYDANTAWHCGNWNQNQRSIGIEHADVSNKAPWRISDACLDNGAHLVAAVCKHYGLGRPQWGKNVFGHSDFAATECPASLAEGASQHDAYMARAQYWYDQMTGSKQAHSSGAAVTSSTIYLVKVTADVLNIRKGPGTNYDITGQIRDKGTYTIVEESNGFGRLKSGAGWISLAYTSRAGSSAAKKSVDEVAKEVIAGKWGNGQDRKNRLAAAGYDYATVQKRVNQLL